MTRPLTMSACSHINRDSHNSSLHLFHYQELATYHFDAIMAKEKKSKHLQARVKFLDQAAKLLAERQLSSPKVSTKTANQPPASTTGLPLLLTSHLRTVSKRGQLRIDQDIKRSICKTCSTPLLDCKTSVDKIENDSKRGAKPHADVRVVECLNCGTKKRFPIGARRQLRKTQRPNGATAGELPEAVEHPPRSDPYVVKACGKG